MSNHEHCWHFGVCCSCGSPAGFEDELIWQLRQEKAALYQRTNRVNRDYQAQVSPLRAAFESELAEADEEFREVAAPVRRQRDLDIAALRGPARLRPAAEQKIRDRANAVLDPAEKRRKEQREEIRDRHGQIQLRAFREWSAALVPLRQRVAEINSALDSLLGIEFLQVDTNAGSESDMIDSDAGTLR